MSHGNSLNNKLQRYCHHCNQPLPETRLGVRLSPLKARIYDLVMRGGLDGILWEDLRDCIAAFSDMNRKSFNNHIHQINELIEDEGYRIMGRGRARLVNLRKQLPDIKIRKK